MEGAFDVITIGTATQDIFYPLASDGFTFEKGAKAEVGAPFCSVGGGAVNAAVTFARQGFKTAALFRIGSDSAGESIVRETEKEGIAAWVHADGVGSSGAVWFAVSDTTLAHDRFVRHRPWMPLAVIVTYHTAQALLVLSVLR